MPIAAPTKDPEAILDYSLDWSPWLATGETIASHVVTVESGITLVSSEISGTKILWRLSGGIEGVSYIVTVEITTSAGQVDQRSVRVPIYDR